MTGPFARRDGPRSWIFGVARKMDPDPWRDRVRSVKQWGNKEELERLATGGQRRRAASDLDGRHGDTLATSRRRPHRIPAARVSGLSQRLLAQLRARHSLRHARGFATAIGYDRAARGIASRCFLPHITISPSISSDIGRSDDAIHHFKRTVELDPNHTLAHYQDLGEMLLERGQLDEASSQFQRAAELEPGSPEPKLRLREVLLRQGRVEEAVASLGEGARFRSVDLQRVRRIRRVVPDSGTSKMSITARVGNS